MLRKRRWSHEFAAGDLFGRVDVCLAAGVTAVEILLIVLVFAFCFIVGLLAGYMIDGRSDWP